MQTTDILNLPLRELTVNFSIALTVQRSGG